MVPLGMVADYSQYSAAKAGLQLLVAGGKSLLRGIGGAAGRMTAGSFARAGGSVVITATMTSADVSLTYQAVGALRSCRAAH